MRSATSSIGGRRTLVHRDEKIAAEEKAEVEGLEIVRVGRFLVKPNADDDHEQVVRVLLELGPAVLRERVLDGERMQPLDLLEQIALPRLADVDVDPEAALLVGDGVVDLVDGEVDDPYARRRRGESSGSVSRRGSPPWAGMVAVTEGLSGKPHATRADASMLPPE